MNKLTAWLDGHFIPDWRKAFAFLSVRFGLIGTAVLTIWATLDDDIHAQLLAWLHINPKWVVPISFIVAVYLRLKRQDGDR